MLKPAVKCKEKAPDLAASSLFKKYCEESTEVMIDDGIEKFFQDIGVTDIEADLVVILILKYMGATKMGEYTFDQFQKGCEALSCSSV